MKINSIHRVLNFLMKALKSKEMNYQMDQKQQPPHDRYVLSALDGKKIMDQEEGTILLDVRTEMEYQSIRIPNAFLLPVDDVIDLVEDLYPNKDLIYIIYCRSGVRSAYARRVMKHLGYHHVYDMGGIIDWPYEKISG